MPVSWPSGIPDSPLLNSLVDSVEDENVIETQMDVEPPKTRPKKSQGLKPISFTIRMTESEWIQFKTYFSDDLSSGALTFDFFHPTKKQIKEMRLFKPYPTARWVSFDGENIYDVAMTMKEYPS